EETGAAVHDAVADGDGRVLLEARAVFGELREHDRERLVVVGDRALVAVFRIQHRGRRLSGLDDDACGVGDHAGALPDPFDQPVGGRELAHRVDQAVLQRRRAAVDDEHDAHAPASCAWIAVSATVLTMSSTRAPRERSLMGLLSPCSTGPIATAPAERCTALYVLLPVLRSGKMNTVARPATSLPGIFEVPTEASTAASYWIGPSTFRSGRRERTSAVACLTLSTSAPLPASPVEYDSIAMRRSISNSSAVAADEIAMS